jgi:hypothetical protein
MVVHAAVEHLFGKALGTQNSGFTDVSESIYDALKVIQHHMHLEHAF